ncbi:MAG TPA: hypothetical protein PL172_10915, partial [Thermomicrobiales bacterium]|nr:hypothetical protein [Thermomicrobiales bacterium]
MDTGAEKRPSAATKARATTPNSSPGVGPAKIVTVVPATNPPPVAITAVSQLPESGVSVSDAPGSRPDA